MGQTEREINTRKKMAQFLVEFSSVGSVRKSAMAVNVPRNTIYGWIRSDTYGFKELYETAKHSFREYLQDIAIDRVKIQKPGDNPVLLITLLNAHWPERYRKDQSAGSDAAKEMMSEWRKWLKKGIKASKEGKKKKETRTESEIEREEAVAEAQKILARRSDGNSNSGTTRG